MADRDQSPPTTATIDAAEATVLEAIARFYNGQFVLTEDHVIYDLLGHFPPEIRALFDPPTVESDWSPALADAHNRLRTKGLLKRGGCCGIELDWLPTPSGRARMNELFAGEPAVHPPGTEVCQHGLVNGGVEPLAHRSGLKTFAAQCYGIGQFRGIELYPTPPQTPGPDAIVTLHELTDWTVNVIDHTDDADHITAVWDTSAASSTNAMWILEDPATLEHAVAVLSDHLAPARVADSLGRTITDTDTPPSLHTVNHRLWRHLHNQTNDPSGCDLVLTADQCLQNDVQYIIQWLNEYLDTVG